MNITKKTQKGCHPRKNHFFKNKNPQKNHLKTKLRQIINRSLGLPHLGEDELFRQISKGL